MVHWKHHGDQPTEWESEWDVAELRGVHLGNSTAV